MSDVVIEDEPASLNRNIRERLLAAQVTSRFGREKILEWYLNIAQYGDLIYGADTAARIYFGKSATMINGAEAAMLTAMSETPALDPFTGFKVLKQRQEQIIETMLIYGLITPGEAQKALDEELHFLSQPVAHPIAPAFTELVLMQLSTVLPLERIRRGGYEIITTLDYDLQMQADCASKVQMARLQGTQELPVYGNGTSCEAAQLLPTLQSGEEKSFQDLLVNVVILEPNSGQILAMVGDDTSGMNPALPAEHPGGTILSPFLYLTAFTRGMSPATLLWDIPGNSGAEEIGPDQNQLTPDKSPSYLGPVRARMAWVNDYFAATAEVLQQVRPENVWLTEKRFGITLPEHQPSYNITLEDLYSQKVSLLESVAAYAILANQGVLTGQSGISNSIGTDPDSLSPSSIIRVLGVDARNGLDWLETHSRSIISPQLAYLATNVLSDENARWPSLGHPNSLEIGRPAGAKAGKSMEGQDAWAVGYIPQLAVGVWVGNSQVETGEVAVDLPAGLWHAIMQYASNQMPVQDFSVPAGISLIQVCDPSGLLVSELCPAIVQEVFLTGNEPTQPDNLYQKYYINRETGLLATIFTPSDMLEEKVYLVVPEHAETWAMQAGLLIPPDTYDVIYATQTESPDVKINGPRMFDHVSGQINLSGSAAGDNFSYFRLQVGQGLYPQHWIQIGEDQSSPVQDGLLGSWETRGLEGLYVVQLLVVRQDQRVDRAILQVTIDNTFPQVQVLSPTEGEKIPFMPGKSLMIQASASDNLVLERVEFYLDGGLVSTLVKPPFVILWPIRSGEHSLLVKAFDLAGNSREETVTFSVDK